MPKYDVMIVETLVKTIPVTAASEQEAYDLVNEQYCNGNIELSTAQDHEEYFIQALPLAKSYFATRFLHKNNPSYSHIITYSDLDEVYDFTEWLAASDEIVDFETPIEVPNSLVIFSGDSNRLVPFEEAMQTEPEWTRSNILLWS